MKKTVSIILLITTLFTILLTSCGGGEEVTKYNDAKALYDAGKYEEAQNAFEAINDYEDSKDWIEKCKSAALDAKYDDATKKLNEGNIVEAYEAFKALGNHKDSADKVAALSDQYKIAKLKNAKAGDVVILGQYEQDNNTDNGTEDIEWIVLDVKDGKALVVSKYVLDFKAVSLKSPWRWVSGGVRRWFNEDFYYSAFNVSEKALIQTTTISPDTTDRYKFIVEAEVKDKVFALNATEVHQYFPGQQDRKCEWTAFAKAASPFSDSDKTTCEWWLRVINPSGYPYLVNENGGVVTSYGRVEKGMRPAMWIDLGA